MTHALLLIATFHAVLWTALAVLTVLEPSHPGPVPRLVSPSPGSPSDEPGARDDDGSLRSAA